MKSYFKTLVVSFFVILASIGMGVTVVFPATPNLVSECMVNKYSNDAYDADSTISSQMNDCLLVPILIGFLVTVFSSFIILILYRKFLGVKEISKTFIMLTVSIYGAIQLFSILLLQSNYLWNANQAITSPEILRSYWFAIDPIVYFLLASTIAWKLSQKKK